MGDSLKIKRFLWTKVTKHIRSCIDASDANTFLQRGITLKQSTNFLSFIWILLFAFSSLEENKTPTEIFISCELLSELTALSRNKRNFSVSLHFCFLSFQFYFLSHECLCVCLSHSINAFFACSTWQNALILMLCSKLAVRKQLTVSVFFFSFLGVCSPHERRHWRNDKMCESNLQLHLTLSTGSFD